MSSQARIVSGFAFKPVGDTAVEFVDGCECVKLLEFVE